MRKLNKRNKKINIKLLLVAFFVSFLLVAFSQTNTIKSPHFDFSSFGFIDGFGKTERNNYEFRAIAQNYAEKFGFEHSGVASFYAHRFHGNRTANGERFNMYDYTAAHRNLPFGTILKVTNLENNKATLVRVNDRGPFSSNRIIDLSKKAADDLKITGTQRVKLEGFKQGSKKLASSLNKRYYFGYSTERDLILVQNNAINLLDSSDYFSQAVRIYNSSFENSKDKSLFIFVRADKQHSSKSASPNFKYYIGTLKESVILEDPNEMALK